LNPSGSNILTIIIVLGIVVYGVTEFICFNRKTKSIIRNINNCNEKISEFNNNTLENFVGIKETFFTNDFLKDEWDEYEHTLIKREEPKRIVYKTEPAEAYFNETRILSKEINIRYWHALPGIFVGLGVLGTFVGLTFGLSRFDTGSSKKIEESIKSLLSGMGTAFLTSVWGLLISIVFSWYEKNQFRKVSTVLSFLNRKINKLFTLTTQEKIAIEQTDQINNMSVALQNFSTDLADRFNIAMDSIMATRLDHLNSIVGKLYAEGENATKQIISEIKASSENISDRLRESIGNIMIEKLSPSLENVADSISNLVPIVESLRDEKKEASLEAITKLVDDFKKSLTDSTKEEMERLSHLIGKAGESLFAFPSHMEGMMKTLDEKSNQIKKLLEQASSQAESALGQRLNEMERFFENITKKFNEQLENQQMRIKQTSDEMKENTTKAAKDFGLVIKDLQDNVKQLLEKQQENTINVDKIINNSASILKEGEVLSQAMKKTIESVSNILTQIQGITNTLTVTANAIEKTGQWLRDTTNQFSKQNEIYLTKNQNTLQQITTTLNDFRNLMGEYVNKFSIIQNATPDMFKKIDEDLRQYSEITRKALNNYLADFSTHLSEAAQKFYGSIEFLQEVVEDLEELLTKNR